MSSDRDQQKSEEMSGTNRARGRRQTRPATQPPARAGDFRVSEGQGTEAGTIRAHAVQVGRLFAARHNDSREGMH